MGTFGKYRLGPKLGQGGMAEIYLAFSRAPDGSEQATALKMLLPGIAEEPGVIDMFLAEANTVAGFDHPSICKILDLGVSEGRYYLALEYIHGQTVSRLWQRGLHLGRPLPPALAGLIALRVAEALTYAHERTDPFGRPLHVVHRDVTPHNVMVSAAGEIKLLDFGIARTAHRIARTLPGLVRGTPAYLSPEQIVSGEVTARSDLFALGAVLHELLSGKRLFASDSPRLTFDRILHQAVPDVIGTELTDGLGQIALAALERDPDRRIGSARDFADRVRQVLGADLPEPAALAEHLQDLFPPTGAIALADENAGGAGGPGEFIAPELGERAATRQTLSILVQSPDSDHQPELTSPRRSLPSLRRWPLTLAGAAVASAAIGAAVLSTRGSASQTRAARPEPQSATSEVIAGRPSDSRPPQPETPVPPAPPAPSAPVQVAAAAAKRGLAHPQRTPSKPARTAAATGRLTLDTSPWTEVYDGERSLGLTPLVDVKLPAGRRRLRAVNPAARVDRVIEVNILPGQNTRTSVTW